MADARLLNRGPDKQTAESRCALQGSRFDVDGALSDAQRDQSGGLHRRLYHGGLNHREIQRDVLNIRSTLTPVAGKFF
jgi:hypothetical protein